MFGRSLALDVGLEICSSWTLRGSRILTKRGEGRKKWNGISKIHARTTRPGICSVTIPTARSRSWCPRTDLSLRCLYSFACLSCLQQEIEASKHVTYILTTRKTKSGLQAHPLKF